MDTGMMWFDDDKNSAVVDKVQRAAEYYREKYKQSPNLCFAHPVTMGKMVMVTDTGVEVRPSGAILPDHFWMGRADAEVSCDS